MGLVGNDTGVAVHVHVHVATMVAGVFDSKVAIQTIVIQRGVPSETAVHHRAVLSIDTGNDHGEPDVAREIAGSRSGKIVTDLRS